MPSEPKSDEVPRLDMQISKSAKIPNPKREKKVSVQANRQNFKEKRNHLPPQETHWT